MNLKIFICVLILCAACGTKSKSKCTRNREDLRSEKPGSLR